MEAVGSGRGPTGLSYREQLASVAVGTWLVVGLFVDGWAHNHDRPESIFTPWHAIFYSGFTACAFVAIGVLRRRQVDTANWRSTIPAGHGLVVVGLAVFAVGGAGDLVWHSVFGIEVDVAALLSPTHLVMFTGALLILSGPLRAAWAGPDVAPALGDFFPALLSLALFTALIAFFFMYLSPFRLGTYGNWVDRYTAAVTTNPGAAGDYADTLGNEAIAAVLVANVIFVAPLVACLRRWRTPFGTFSITYTIVGTLMVAIDGFERWQPLFAATIAGVAADGLVRRLQPSAARPWALRTVAGAVPVVMWLSFFALFNLIEPVGWEPELWAGVTVMAALSGLGLSLLVVPPPAPLVVAGGG